MNLVNWEQDVSGAPASIALPKSKSYISPSAAAFMVKNLMHEVTTISANFTAEDIGVFARLAGISVFGEKNAEYLGLYASSTEAETADYCLRRCFWECTFRSSEAVVKALKAQTVFFNSARLMPKHRGIVLSLDRDVKDNWQIFSRATEDSKFFGKKIAYFATDNQKMLSGEYNGRSSTNPAVEKIFHDLKLVSDSLSDEMILTPLPQTLKISYSFFGVLESLGVVNLNED